MKTLFKTVQSALDMKQIIIAGPFIYYIIQEVRHLIYFAQLWISYVIFFTGMSGLVHVFSPARSVSSRTFCAESVRGDV